MTAALSVRLSALRRAFVLARDGQRPFTDARADQYLHQLDELCRDVARLEAVTTALDRPLNRRGRTNLTNFSIVRRTGGGNVRQ